jgi:hypothetical protein
MSRKDVKEIKWLIHIYWHSISLDRRLQQGRAIAQAVSRRLPTAAAQVQTRVWSCGIL